MKQFKLISILLIVMLAFSACSSGEDPAEQPPIDTPEGPTINELAEVEVREYEGEDLSSILDFRENSIKGPQDVDIDAYRLTVDGLVDNPMEYTYDEALGFDRYSKVVNMYCVEGWSVNLLWEGIKVADLLEQAGIDPSAKTVIFHAVDEYTTSVPLDFILDNDILLAYKMNDVVLPKERGFPFQLVAQDKLGYKWIKWVTRIELSDDENYKGFWESRGYNNEADI
ncbi:molybdopterin-dependent oxidoreductase [Clostridia bacterium]|nr:molybdopterin-dependent oxidoreductase [Clostridia bacterium]